MEISHWLSARIDPGQESEPVAQIIGIDESIERTEIRRDVNAAFEGVTMLHRDVDAHVTSLLSIREDKGETEYARQLSILRKWGSAAAAREAAETNWGEVSSAIALDVIEEFIPAPLEGYLTPAIAEASQVLQSENVSIQTERDEGRPVPAVARQRSRRTARLARKRAARAARTLVGPPDRTDKLWYARAGIRRRKGGSENLALEMEVDPIDVPTVSYPDPGITTEALEGVLTQAGSISWGA